MVPQRLLLVSQFYRPELIGIAAYASDMAEWFAERGSNVTVVTARPNYPNYEVVESYRRGRRDDEEIGGVRVARLHTLGAGRGGASRRVLHEAWLLLGTLWALVRGRVRRHDHVISFCPSILLVLAASLMKRRGGRHVAVVHDIQSGLAAGLGMVRPALLIKLMQGIERVVLAGADRVVVLTEPMKQRLREVGIERAIEVLPLWVDPSRIFPVPRPPGERPVVAYSGNLGRKQGLEQIVEMAALLRTRGPEVRIVIRGEGSQKPVLIRTAVERELDNLEFRSLVARDGLNEALAEADLFVVPQLPGGADSAIPSKIFDIMAAGKTFVCTAAADSTLGRFGQATDAFECVDPGDVAALTDRVLRLLEQPDRRRRLGMRGRRYVEQNLERNMLLSRFAQLLTIA